MYLYKHSFPQQYIKVSDLLISLSIQMQVCSIVIKICQFNKENNWHHIAVLTCISLISVKLSIFLHFTGLQNFFTFFALISIKTLVLQKDWELWYYGQPSAPWTGSKGSILSYRTLRIRLLHCPGKKVKMRLVREMRLSIHFPITTDRLYQSSCFKPLNVSYYFKK